MKKIGINKSIKRICIGILLIWLCYKFWEGALSNFIPWTRTWFYSHESFDDLLETNHCFAGGYFIQELPQSANDVRYYWHRQFVEKFAAYSMLLEEMDYTNIIPERLEYYQEQDIKLERKRIVYEFKGEDYWYIEDSELYQKYFSFISEILHNPEAEGQYYYIVINKLNTINGTCYNGVILNDVTHEVVEFSVEIREEKLQ